MRLSGKLIVLEGLDGSGTTTQAGMLKRSLEDQLEDKVYLTREPTNGPVGSILQLALEKRLVCPRPESSYQMLSPATLALLFAADRLDHLFTDILSKLEAAAIVICDRYYLSSFAYQSLDVELEWIEAINAKAIPPDLTVLIDVPAPLCMERIRQQRWHLELFEDISKLTAVRETYLRLAADPRRAGDKIEVVDGTGEPAEVHRDVLTLVWKHLGPYLMGRGARGPEATGGRRRGD